MSTDQVVVQGTLKADGSLQLKQKLPLPPGPVEVTIRPIRDADKKNVWTVLEQIWAERRVQGVPSRTRQEIDAEIRQMREEWEG